MVKVLAFLLMLCYHFPDQILYLLRRQEIELSTFKDQMTENEWKGIMQAGAQKEAFYEYWTKKEAVTKAHGKGLSLSLKSFEIVEDKTTINNKHYWVKQLEVISGYKCFLAVRTLEDILKYDITIRRIDLSTLVT